MKVQTLERKIDFAKWASDLKNILTLKEWRETLKDWTEEVKYQRDLAGGRVKQGNFTLKPDPMTVKFHAEKFLAAMKAAM